MSNIDKDALTLLNSEPLTDRSMFLMIWNKISKKG